MLATDLQAILEFHRGGLGKVVSGRVLLLHDWLNKHALYILYVHCL